MSGESRQYLLRVPIESQFQQTGVVDQTLDRMIGSALTSADARRHGRVNLARVERCLVGFKPEIALDFDDACAEGQRRDLRVLNNIFRTYVWSCV